MEVQELYKHTIQKLEPIMTIFLISLWKLPIGNTDKFSNSNSSLSTNLLLKSCTVTNIPILIFQPFGFIRNSYVPFVQFPFIYPTMRFTASSLVDADNEILVTNITQISTITQFVKDLFIKHRFFYTYVIIFKTFL